LTAEQEEKLAAIVEQGPPADGTLVRWRRIDLQEVIKREFNVEYHERSVGKILRRLGFVRLSVRPLHPEADAQAQEDFKKTSLPRSRKSCPVTPRENPSKSGSKMKPALARKAH
jgi:transposase